MKKCFVLFLCCLGLVVSLQGKAFAAKDSVEAVTFQAEAVETANPVEFDPTAVTSKTFNADAEDEKIVHVAPRGHGIDMETLRELKRRADQPDLQIPPFDRHIPDLPDAADENSQGHGWPHEASPASTASFPGTDWATAISVPPDSTIAVGVGGFVVVAVNQVIAVYLTNGTLIVPPVDFNTWFSNVGASGFTLFDPWVVYDKFINRFYFLVTGHNTNTNESSLFFSVSGWSPSADKWCNYKIASTTGAWHDYPKVGFNDKGVYITSNKQNWPVTDPTFKSPYLLAFRKGNTPFFQSTPGHDTCTSSIEGPTWSGASLTNEDGTQAFAVQPAQTWDDGAAEYLVNSRVNWNPFGGYWNGLSLWQVTWSGDIPSLQRLPMLSVTPYTVPPDAKQPPKPDGTAAYRLDTSSGQLLNAAYRDGILWTTHTVKSTDYATSAVRIYRINPAAMTADLDKQFHSSSGHYYFNPSVMPFGSGKVAAVLNRSSADEWADLRYAKREAGTWSQTRIKPGEGTYTLGYDAKHGGYRWGDYAGSAPSLYEESVWLYSQYPKQGNSAIIWGTEFFKVQ